MPTYRSFLLLLVTAIALASLATTTRAEPPPLLPIQGYLSGADGTLLDDGSYTIRFRLYDSADPGVVNALHDETLDGSVVAGQFTVYLGDTANGGSALDLAVFRDTATVYLGIKVSTDEEGVPRLQLATSAFAAVASYCGDASTLGGQPASAYTYTGGAGVSVDGSNQISVDFAGSGSADTAARSDHDHGESLEGLSGCEVGDVPVWNGSGWECGEQRARLFDTEPTLVEFATVAGTYAGGGSTHQLAVYIETATSEADPDCHPGNLGMTRVVDRGGGAEQFFCFCNKVNLTEESPRDPNSDGTDGKDFRWWCIEVEP